MNLSVQRRVASSVLGCGTTRVLFAPDRLKDIKEAITKEDMRQLVVDGAVSVRPLQNVSRGRARKVIVQRRKGRRQGKGSRRGSATARLSTKDAWISRVRVQREFLSELRQKRLITPATYTLLRARVKGGFFRSRRHVQLFMTERGLFVKKDGNQ